MKPVVLSPSSINLFLECPRCFWLDKVRRIRHPSGVFPSLPAGMDRVLKAHFDLHRHNGSLPEELSGVFRGRLFTDEKRLRVWRNNLRGLRFTDEESGVTLMGAVDDILETEDGRYAPLDFKTRGYPRKEDTTDYYQHQMDLYSLLLEKNGLPPAGYAVLIFYHPTGVTNRHDVAFDPDPVKIQTRPERGAKKFREAVTCLKGEEPPSNQECEWCNFLKQLVF